MDKGFVIIAQDGGTLTTYQQCADALAKSIKRTMPDAKVSIITDNKIKNKSLYDKIIPLPYGDQKQLTIFLAGSIEMGAAENWQEVIPNQFQDREDIIFLNPRRDDWDSSWEQTEANPQFNEQVNWEMDMLDKCDIIFMYFSPGTKSPISLAELGLYAASGKMIVCCPDEFWRKGNVDVICSRYNVPIYSSLDSAIGRLRTVLKNVM
jgi:hypothetical protein